MSATGLQLPFGIQPVNPVPVDTWSGPYSASTAVDAVALANASIPSPIRFQSMEVRLIVGGVAKKYWYRDGVADVNLVEFASGSLSESSSSVTTVAWQFMEIPAGNVDDANTTFTLAHNPSPSNSLMLFVNGVLQLQGADYDYTLSSNVATTSRPILAGSKIVATYSYVQSGSSISWMEHVVGDKNGMNMTFTINNIPSPSNSLMFFYNGVLQLQGSDYTLSGNSITMFVAPKPQDNLAATYSY
jgi:hypothetical protein